jgi:hypothetical protein
VTEERFIQIPRYYQPYPHQAAAWKRRRSGKWPYYIKLWARQLGKDTDDIQDCLNCAWKSPGTQSAYVGLDNVWISNNIFKKYIDGRTHWEDYPPEYIEVKDTQKEVYMTNNPEGIAPARIKFIGFLNDQALIGSSYDRFYFSEGSLYPRNAFQYIEPIWDRKLAMGLPLSVNVNGTPRGMKNVFYELIKTYTGVEDPTDFPGDHGICYVDKVTIEDAMVPDGNGGFKKLYTMDEIERLRDRYIRAYGNDALFRQENYCDFTVVNAGLVYRGIEQLVNEGRYCKLNLDTHRPVYVAFDIASKGKESDSTAAIVFQYYNGRMLIYDIYEARSISLVEAIAELARRDYFHLIRWGILPWDSERSASSQTPIEEARAMFPSINWHALEKERVDRGIQLVREQLPNMVINSDRCDYLIEAFNNYEYKRLERLDDWSAKPAHTKYSHIMDALRYAAMGIGEKAYFQLNDDGGEVLDWNQTYSSTYDSEEPKWDKPYPEHWVKRKKEDNGLFYT